MMRFVSIFKRPRGETLPGALPALFALLLMVWAGLPARAVGPGTQYLVKYQPDWTRGGNEYTGWWDYTPGGLFDWGGTLYFMGHTTAWGLWKSNGSTAGTGLDSDLMPQKPFCPYPQYMFNLNGVRLFFTYDYHQLGLWRSDRTSSGTVMIKDLTSTSLFTQSNPRMVSYQGRAYFFMNHSDGTRLWRTDGTTSGTEVVKQLTTSVALQVSDIAESRGYLYFQGGNSLYRSDGTSAGTGYIGRRLGSYLTDVNGSLFYFRFDTLSSCSVLCKGDGTTSGAQSLSGDFVGMHSNFYRLAPGATTLYFTADDGTHGMELWKSDGTPGGTVMVRDIDAGTTGSAPENLTVVNGELYFSVKSGGGHGVALWKSDGTAAGTVMVREFSAPGSAHPVVFTRLVNANGRLYFRAGDDVNGGFLWCSNGTPGGTLAVPFAAPAPGYGQNPEHLTVSGDRLFYVASCGSAGSGLWAVDLKAPNAARNWTDYQ